MLAEGPVKAYVRSNFNVELHYLRLRKLHQQGALKELGDSGGTIFILYAMIDTQLNFLLFTAPDSKSDPVCVLKSKRIENDKSLRLCTVVLTSSYFEGRIPHPHREISFGCMAKKVSFRTQEGMMEAKGTEYDEFMLECRAFEPRNPSLEGEDGIFYIS